MSGEYYRTKETVAEYIKAAEGYNGQYLIDKLKPLLPGGSSLLEIGSGPGSDWEILNGTFEVVGSDMSVEFLNHLRARFADGRFMQLDAETLDTDKKFDCIYSNKVLHHLTDQQLDDSVKRQCDLLTPDGLICHSFWKGEGSEVFKGLFVNYHTEKKLTELFQDQFEIITMDSYQEFEGGDSILVIGRKK